MNFCSRTSSRIDLTRDEPLVYVSCPKVPADPEAKIGYRRSHHNPDKKKEKKKRVSFVSRKQCLTCPLAVPNPIGACKYLGTECGYSTHMSIKAHPRLVSEIPRCSYRWKKIRNLRSASERSNGTCKSSDLDILSPPRIYGLTMASIEATMACITTLLKRVMHFVIGVTLNLVRYLKTWDKSYKEKLKAPEVPAFILSLLQRKRSPP